MNVAYYEYGNLKEEPDKCGLGTIYGKNGNLILKEDEYIIVSLSNIGVEIAHMKENHYHIGERVFHYAGKGTIYRTTQRIVYIREPSIAWQTAVHIPWVPDIGHAAYAKYWKEHGYKECWELPLNEIYYILEKKRYGASFIFVISDEKVYYIAFPNRNCNDIIWQDIYPGRTVKSVKEGLKKCNEILKQMKKQSIY